MIRNRFFAIVYLLLLLKISIILSGCKRTIDQELIDHPKLSDSILSRAARLPLEKQIGFVNLEFTKFNPGPEDLWKRYGFIREYHFKQRDYYRTSAYADSMINAIEPVAKKSKSYRENLIKAYFVKGDAEITLNNFKAAIKFFDMASKLENTDPTTQTSRFFSYNMRLASGFYKQENFKQALKYYKLALLDKSDDNDPWIAFTFNQAMKDNIGLCFSSLGEADSALYYFNQTLAYIEQHEGKYTGPDRKTYINIAKGIVYGNKAKVLLTIGRKAEAERLMNMDIELTENTFGSEEAELSRERLAALYLERGETDRVIRLLDTIKTWADKPTYVNRKQKYLELLAEVSVQLGNHSKANVAYKQLLHLNDSLAREKNANIQENLEHLVAYNEHAKQLSSLQEEKTNARILLSAIVLILLMSLLIAVLLCRNYRRFKANMNQLKLLNENIHVRNVELERTFEALELSYEANARITQLVAHDLRSPIIAMRNFVKLLDNTAICPNEKSQLAKLIYINCSDALSLIEDMLNNNTSSEHLMLEYFELSALVKHCIDQQRKRSEAKKQHIQFFPSLVILHGDAEKIRRVFDNLLTNAIKFTDTKGLISVEIEVSSLDVTISITDNGIGIPENIREKLFDISADIKRKGTANESSHGLGLFICRKIVKAHRGDIWFRSVPGIGSVFSVQLPRYGA